MASPDEVRAAIKVGQEALADAIAAASDNWEKSPQSGEGEDAWSPRQVAEHVIPAEIYFANAVCAACGYWLRGLGDDIERCPECGSQREPMPETESS